MNENKYIFQSTIGSRKVRITLATSKEEIKPRNYLQCDRVVEQVVFRLNDFRGRKEFIEKAEKMGFLK